MPSPSASASMLRAASSKADSIAGSAPAGGGVNTNFPWTQAVRKPSESRFLMAGDSAVNWTYHADGLAVAPSTSIASLRIAKRPVMRRWTSAAGDSARTNWSKCPWRGMAGIVVGLVASQRTRNDSARPVASSKVRVRPEGAAADAPGRTSAAAGEMPAGDVPLMFAMDQPVPSAAVRPGLRSAAWVWAWPTTG